MGSAEVIIVGGGPAGAAAALRLARAGRDVLLLERSRFPRDKPCGDCVNPGAVAELADLGVADELRAKLAPRQLRGWYVEAPDGRSFRASFGDQPGADGAGIGNGNEGGPLAWALRRRELDAALLGLAAGAGARIIHGCSVYDLLRERGRVVGVLGRDGARERRLRARWVVGADGLRSVVRNRLGLAARSPKLRKIALVGHPQLSEAGRMEADAAYGELRVRNGRCLGYAPLAAGVANVTLVVPAADAVDMKGDTEGFFRRALRDFPEIRARVGGLDDQLLITGPFDWPVRKPWAPGAVLVGDAAGYFDPFTGQGVHEALRSARLAAAALEDALANPGEAHRAMRAYGRGLQTRSRATRGLQRAVEAVISRPGLMGRMVGTLGAGDGSAARQLLRATGDLVHPVSVLNPFVWARAIMGGRLN